MNTIMPYLKRKAPQENPDHQGGMATPKIKSSKPASEAEKKSSAKSGGKSSSKSSSKSGSQSESKSGAHDGGKSRAQTARKARAQKAFAHKPSAKDLQKEAQQEQAQKEQAQKQGEQIKQAPHAQTKSAQKTAPIQPLRIPKHFGSLQELDGMARPFTRRPVKDAPPARALALSVLRTIIRDGADLQAALDDSLSTSSISRQDASLCTELVYGYLRSELRVAWLIRQFLKMPSKIPTDVLAIMGLAAYEITSLDRIPVYASVDWTVTCIRKGFGEGYAKLANAVLRNLVRQQEANQAVGMSADAFYTTALPDLASRLVIQYATPPWLVDLWLSSYGDALTERLLKASCQHPASAVRLNGSRFNVDAVREDLLQDVAFTMAQDDRGYDADGTYNEASVPSSDVVMDANVGVNVDMDSDEAHTETPRTPDYVAPTAESIQARINELGISSLVRPVGKYGLMFARGAMPLHVEGLQKKGLLSRQSGASQGVLLALEPKTWPAPVWDCCCGRGGKTAALMEMGVDVIAASDVSNPRLRGLQKDFLRLCLQQPHFVFRAPAESLSADLQFAPQTILIDAPCSGLGTLSRRPDIKLRRTEEQIEGLIKTQQRILDVAWQRLPQGGLIVYITCTRNLNENQHQIERILALHENAELVTSFETPLDDPSNEFFYGAVLRKG